MPALRQWKTRDGVWVGLGLQLSLQHGLQSWSVGATAQKEQGVVRVGYEMASRIRITAQC